MTDSSPPIIFTSVEDAKSIFCPDLMEIAFCFCGAPALPFNTKNKILIFGSIVCNYGYLSIMEAAEKQKEKKEGKNFFSLLSVSQDFPL